MVDTDSEWQSPYDVGVTVGLTTSRAQCPAGYSVVGAGFTRDVALVSIARVQRVILACRAIDVGTPTDEFNTGSTVYVSNPSNSSSTAPIHAPSGFIPVGVIGSFRTPPLNPYLKSFAINYRDFDIDPDELNVSVEFGMIEASVQTHVSGVDDPNASAGNVDMNDCGGPSYSGGWANRDSVNVLVGLGTFEYSVIGGFRIGGLRMLCQTVNRVELPAN